MPRLNVPSEGTSACAACRKPRGNTRRGWAPILHGAAVVGFTCPDCPEAAEPIRRVESTTGVRFCAVVNTTPSKVVPRRQVTRTLPTLEAARAFVAEVRSHVCAERLLPFLSEGFEPRAAVGAGGHLRRSAGGLVGFSLVLLGIPCVLIMLRAGVRVNRPCQGRHVHRVTATARAPENRNRYFPAPIFRRGAVWAALRSWRVPRHPLGGKLGNLSPHKQDWGSLALAGGVRPPSPPPPCVGAGDCRCFDLD